MSYYALTIELYTQSSFLVQSGGKPAPGPTGDAREFVEEVDLLKRLKATNYQELIVEEKWSEQLKGLQLIIEIIGERLLEDFSFF